MPCGFATGFTLGTAVVYFRGRRRRAREKGVTPPCAANCSTPRCSPVPNDLCSCWMGSGFRGCELREQVGLPGKDSRPGTKREICPLPRVVRVLTRKYFVSLTFPHDASPKDPCKATCHFQGNRSLCKNAGELVQSIRANVVALLNI